MNSLSKSYWSRRWAYCSAYLSSPHGLRRTIKLSAKRTGARLFTKRIILLVFGGGSVIYLFFAQPALLNRLIVFLLILALLCAMLRRTNYD